MAVRLFASLLMLAKYVINKKILLQKLIYFLSLHGDILPNIPRELRN